MSEKFTQLQRRMFAAAGEMITKSPFAGGGWKPEGPPGISYSEKMKILAFHIKGQTALGLITLHVFFDEVDEKKGTFKMRNQILFSGVRGELEPGQEDNSPQVFWGGSLGWRVRF